MRSHRPLARVHSHRPLPPACTRRYNEDSKLKEEKRLRKEERHKRRAASEKQAESEETPTRTDWSSAVISL